MINRIIILLIAGCTVSNAYAQNDKKDLIGTHFALGINSSYGDPLGSIGGPGYKEKYYYRLGFDYSRKLSKHWDFCTGFEYTYSLLTVHPADCSGDQGIVSPQPYNDDLKIGTIPFQMKYHFAKFFYVNGGLLLNVFSKHTREQSTYERNRHMLLGCGLGVGVEHEFSNGITLSLNPFFRWNGLENAEKLQSLSKSLFMYRGAVYVQTGVSLGIGYRF